MAKPPVKRDPARDLVVKGKAAVPAFRNKVVAVIKALEEKKRKENIPNASVIYGAAAAVLFVIALYYLFTGSWLNGFLVFVLGAAMFGYALHFLQNPD